MINDHEEIELHNQFVDYGKNAKEWLRKCALLLPEIDRRQIWKKKGFISITEYAAKLAGMSKNSVREALRVMRKVEDKPALRKLVEEREINCVRPIVAIATQETEMFWAEKARQMSINTLKTYVHDYRIQEKSHHMVTSQSVKSPSEEHLGENLFSTNREPAQPFKVHIEMELDPDVANQLRKLKGEGGWDALMKEFLQLREEKMEREKPAIVENAPRYIHAEMDHYVTNRTSGKCAFPGCNKPIDFLHHTQRYALERVHDPDRLWGLCRAHNEIAHNGLIENEEGPPSTWRLREEPDRNIAKYYIDQQVATYRKRG